MIRRLPARAAPALLGFGIGHPDHVRQALDLGAAGAISSGVTVTPDTGKTGTVSCFRALHCAPENFQKKL